METEKTETKVNYAPPGGDYLTIEQAAQVMGITHRRMGYLVRTVIAPEEIFVSVKDDRIKLLRRALVEQYAAQPSETPRQRAARWRVPRDAEYMERVRAGLKAKRDGAGGKAGKKADKGGAKGA